VGAKDRFHDVVKIALEKEGWNITHDPLTLRVDAVTDLHIDLGAEMLIAAEREGEKIAVEIKSFLGQSAINDFHAAIGQFINYRYALEDLEPTRKLYLAISLTTYEVVFIRRFIQSVVERAEVSLIIYDTEKEVIVKWQI
jgi:XisH protein